MPPVARPRKIEPGRPDVVARAARASDAIKGALWRELRRQPIALRRLSLELGRTSGFLHNLLDTRPSRRNVGLRVEDLFALCELLELDPIAFLTRLQRRGDWETPPLIPGAEAREGFPRPVAHPAGADDLEEGVLRLARGLVALVESAVDRSGRGRTSFEGCERPAVTSTRDAGKNDAVRSVRKRVRGDS